MAEKIRLGLIGASVRGTWSSRSHLPAAKASGDIELTAVCTTRADSAEAARQAYGARLAFDDWHKLVASPEVDAVAVVVRVPSHYEPTKAALEAGKHVYCEWPLGRDTAEAVRMLEAAERKGVCHAVGLQGQASPAINYLRDLVADDLDPFDVNELLELICLAAIDAVRGPEYAGITLADRPRPATADDGI